MIYDYSCRYSSMIRRKQNIAGRRQGRLNLKAWAWRATGVVVFSAMLLGVVTSFWLRMAIRDGLDDLASQEQLRRNLIAMNTSLKARRENLLAEERIGRLARDMGLSPLASGQIRQY